MPLDASSTRQKLIDEAARAFAAHGVFGASLIDITRRVAERFAPATNFILRGLPIGRACSAGEDGA